MADLKRNARGFTLIELIVVIAIIGILAAITIPPFTKAPQRAREAVLKTNLHALRDTFDQYYADKAHYPESLETLVADGYLREVPMDPITGSPNTWDLVYSDEMAEEDLGEASGIFDVKSGSRGQALDGTEYKDW